MSIPQKRKNLQEVLESEGWIPYGSHRKLTLPCTLLGDDGSEVEGHHPDNQYRIIAEATKQEIIELGRRSGAPDWAADACPFWYKAVAE